MIIAANSWRDVVGWHITVEVTSIPSTVTLVLDSGDVSIPFTVDGNRVSFIAVTFETTVKIRFDNEIKVMHFSNEEEGDALQGDVALPTNVSGQVRRIYFPLCDWSKLKVDVYDLDTNKKRELRDQTENPWYILDVFNITDKTINGITVPCFSMDVGQAYYLSAPETNTWSFLRNTNFRVVITGVSSIHTDWRTMLFVDPAVYRGTFYADFT